MVNKFHPEVNKVYFVKTYTLFHILEGDGAIEVDFQNYTNWEDKLIFLDKGQYIKFISNNFLVRKIEFDQEIIFKHKDVRVLFKHLVSLGYINFQECEACQHYLNDTVFSAPTDIIDISTHQWYWQNPFNADVNEYHLIFDLKEVIDEHIQSYLPTSEVIRLLGKKEKRIHKLVKDKVGLTVKGMMSRKRLTESQKDVAFSDKSMKEIAYQYGYKDPSYFNRIFKKNTGVTPNEFREQIAFQSEDHFSQIIFELLKEFHTQERDTAFYAQKLHVSKKTLSKKVKDTFNQSLGQLIRYEIIHTAKQYLAEGMHVKEVAFALGFEEANHFSTFFKRYTGQTPTEYLVKKYHK